MGNRIHITEGDWRVPLRQGVGGRGGVGVTVISGESGREVVVADCYNRHLPRAEQEANAQLIAKAPRMEEALRRIEAKVGDMPAKDPATSTLYAVVARAMSFAGLDVGDEE
jgi:hypothetical protein